MFRCLALALVALTFAVPSLAQVQRNFPANALRGTIAIDTPPQVVLNAQPARLAPGARIFGQDNMLRLSGTLVGQKMLVHYTVDIQGLVKDVWILTANEAARKPWPTTQQELQTWQFDAAAQVWTKP
jgi:hypothetical protein